MNSKSYSNIGFSSIMVVFVTIAFLSFGVLSLMTARADNKLTKKTAERNSDYYSVLSDSERLLGDLDTSLSQLYTSSSNEEAYFSSVNELLSSENGTFSTSADSFTYNSDDHSLTYSLRVSSLQVLSVELIILYPAEENDYHFYEMINEKTYTDMEEEATEETLHLLGGN
ncbi:MAG: hypothetical protein K6E13_10380 [Lachnospiraceae bacterium]|nr:hypothetical protein [Lachnospiraceae bacterium]